MLISVKNAPAPVSCLVSAAARAVGCVYSFGSVGLGSAPEANSRQKIMAEDLRNSVIALFDIDGTLTPPRLVRHRAAQALVAFLFRIGGHSFNKLLIT